MADETKKNVVCLAKQGALDDSFKEAVLNAEKASVRTSGLTDTVPAKDGQEFYGIVFMNGAK